MLTRFFILGLSLLVLSLAGCQPTPTATPITTPTDTLADPKALALNPHPVHVRDLLPLEPQQGLYRFLEGNDAGQDVPFSFLPDPEKPGLWRQELQGYAITWFKRLDDGSLAIVREDDLQEDVSVEYEPALIVLPANLSSTPFRAAGRMTVRDLDDGRFKTAGPCEYDVQYLGIQKLATWAGAIDVHLIQVHRQIRLPIAKVNVQIITAYRANRGNEKNNATKQDAIRLAKEKTEGNLGGNLGGGG